MNFSSMLCLAFANAEGFMSLWKPEDQGVPATNDLVEIEDLTLTAPSPLQRLLSDEDDEEQEEDEDDDGNDEWSKLQVALGTGGAGLVVGGLGVGLLAHRLNSSPEKRLVIEATALTKDQKDALKTDDKVEHVEGNHIISTYKDIDAFKAEHAGVTVSKQATQVMGTFVKCGETFLSSIADNKWEAVATTKPEGQTEPVKPEGNKPPEGQTEPVKPEGNKPPEGQTGPKIVKDDPKATTDLPAKDPNAPTQEKTETPVASV